MMEDGRVGWNLSRNAGTPPLPAPHVYAQQVKQLQVTFAAVQKPTLQSLSTITTREAPA
jgi:hypothetical protein